MGLRRKIAEMNGPEYKKYHEAFMQNNDGSSAAHVFFCILFTVQCAVYSSIRLRKCKSYQYFYEYIIIVLPLIVAHTILTDYIYVLNVGIMPLVLYEFYKQPKIKKNKPMVKNTKVYSISIMRGLTYIITVFAILAVDFTDFPRHLAKTERYGYSLMDTGVGLFVLMSGLVHKDLRQLRLIDIIWGNMKFICVLVFLGVGRYLSVKQLDYPEHVTEYGAHWNFFFTLAVCKLFSTIVLYFNINALIYSFILLLTHEYVLIYGVQDFVFSNALRDTFVSANREGISSCLGYVCLYLFAAHVKTILCEKSANMKVKLFNYTLLTNQTQILLVCGSVGLWSMLYVIDIYRPISRTLANSAYCIYLEAVLLTIVSVLYYIENLLQDAKSTFQPPKIIEQVNKNGLPFFLAANVLTGVVNLSTRTLLASSFDTFVILNVYMILTLTFAVFFK